MTNVILYGPPPSSYFRTARMTCIEKKVPHEIQPVDMGTDAHKALHPWKKVPIMKHGDVTLYETAAICRYIDDAFDGPSLVPDTPAARGVMDQWISVLDCYMYDHMIRNYSLQYIFPRGPDGAPDRGVIDKNVPLMNQDFDELEKALNGKEFIAGTLSLADLFFAPVLATTILFPEGKQAIEGRKSVHEFFKRMSDRVSFKEVSPPPPQ